MGTIARQRKENTMLTYQKALETIKGARNGRKKLENNTYLEQRENGIAVKLHDTDVVLIHKNNTFSLFSGGWRTVTTKERLNSYSPARIYQEKGTWFILGKTPEGYPDHSVKFLYQDGMKVDRDGIPLKKWQKGTEKRDAAMRKLKKAVKSYIDGFSDHIRENGLADPSQGDCWGCMMKATDGTFPIGKDGSHLIKHFKESYFVPSLLWNAIQEQGYREPGLIWQVIKADAANGRESYHMKNALRRYFQKRNEILISFFTG